MLVVLASSALLSCKNETNEANEMTTNEATAEATNSPIAAENLKTESFTIEGMTCELGCAKAIEGKLAGLNGVQEATVDFENKTATISFDETKQNKISLKKTIEAVAGGETYKATETEKKESI